MSQTFGPCGQIIVEGGSGFAADNIVYGTIPTGSSGDILFVPAVQGVVIRLSALSCSQGPETGITISCGSRPVLISGSLEDGTTSNASLGSSIVIGPSFGGGASNVLEINTLPGESLTITKDTGTTGSNIYYTHQIGA